MGWFWLAVHGRLSAEMTKRRHFKREKGVFLRYFDVSASTTAFHVSLSAMGSIVNLLEERSKDFEFIFKRTVRILR
jgi:hypothetical protein